MKKGISAVISVLLIVFILISLTAAVFLLLTRISSITTSTGQEELGNMEEKVMTFFKIDSIDGNSVYMRNIGAYSIDNNSLSVYLNNINVNYTLSKNMSQDESGTLNVTGLSDFALGPYVLKIASKGSVYEQNVNLIRKVDYFSMLLEFDEGSGDIGHDTSNENNDVSCTGSYCPEWVSVDGRSGIRFDGGDDYMISNVWDGYPNGGEEIVYSAWVYLFDDRANVIIVGFPNEDDTALEIDNGHLRFAIYNDTVQYYTHDQPLEKRIWYQVMGAYENGNVHLSVNGSAQHWLGIPYVPRGSSENRIIIGAYSTSQYFFHGIVDDVKIYNEYSENYENVSLVMA